MLLVLQFLLDQKQNRPKQNIRMGIVNHKNQLIPCSFKYAHKKKYLIANTVCYFVKI